MACFDHRRFPTSAFFRVNPKLLPLARWENDGEVYDRRSVRAFRWVLLQSPLGWINPSLYLSGNRSDLDRLLRRDARRRGRALDYGLPREHSGSLIPCP